MLKPTAWPYNVVSNCKGRVGWVDVGVTVPKPRLLNQAPPATFNRWETPVVPSPTLPSNVLPVCASIAVPVTTLSNSVPIATVLTPQNLEMFTLLNVDIPDVLLIFVVIVSIFNDPVIPPVILRFPTTVASPVSLVVPTTSSACSGVSLLIPNLPS